MPSLSGTGRDDRVGAGIRNASRCPRHGHEKAWVGATEVASDPGGYITSDSV